MDLKKEFKIGSKVLCIKEDDLPNFIGKVWTVKHIHKDLIYCENLSVYRSVNEPIYNNGFPFRKDEVVLLTPLVEELL